MLFLAQQKGHETLLFVRSSMSGSSASWAQLDDLRKYADIAEVPPPLRHFSAIGAQAHGLLNKEEQSAYDYAVQHSDTQGPFCCKCWRWKGKYLIRVHRYTGEQLVDLWNVGQGCGGGYKDPLAPPRQARLAPLPIDLPQRNSREVAVFSSSARVRAALKSMARDDLRLSHPQPLVRLQQSR